MNTEARHDSPFTTADPRSAGLMLYEDEECQSTGSCYPTDDGEADLVDPTPAPVSSVHRDLRPQSLADQLLASLRALVEGCFPVALQLCPGLGR